MPGEKKEQKNIGNHRVPSCQVKGDGGEYHVEQVPEKVQPEEFFLCRIRNPLRPGPPPEGPGKIDQHHERGECPALKLDQTVVFPDIETGEAHHQEGVPYEQYHRNQKIGDRKGSTQFFPKELCSRTDQHEFGEHQARHAHQKGEEAGGVNHPDLCVHPAKYLFHQS